MNADTSPLAAAALDREVMLFMGPGGVGKTTLAASTALWASRHRRTLLLTVDPAKRLATALGLDLGHEVRPVREGLDAAMVDTQIALDELVATYAKDEAHLERVTSTRFYEVLTDAMVGSEEFAAMGLLHEHVVHGDYDLVIVDTPPGPHGLDLLTVNDRLLRVFGSGLTKVLFHPSRLLAVLGSRLFGGVGRWTDQTFLEDMAHFMAQFEGMFLDMKERVDRMQTLIGDQQRTALILVTSAEPGVVDGTLRLVDELSNLDRDPLATVVNRYLPPLAGTAVEGEEESLLDHYRAWARTHQEGIHRLREVAGRAWPVPNVGPVVGLDGLEDLHRFLFEKH